MKNVYVLIQLLGLILFFMAFPVGLLLGLILILLGGIMYRKEAKKDKEKKSFKKCPYCAESIQKSAVLCKHCGSKLG